MRAALIDEPGGTPYVGSAAEPRRAAGQALVRMLAAALNPLDLAIGSGRIVTDDHTWPYVVGYEGVGEVVDGDRLVPGTLVWFISPSAIGTFAELCTADESDLIVLDPRSAPDPVVAAALGVAGQTGWLAVEWRAQLAAGERVLVLGATGSVGLVAVQAARALGAGTVVAAGRDPEALARAQEAGADAVVALGETDPETLTQAFLDAAGGPLDVIVDPLWGRAAEAALDAGALGCRHVQLGHTAGFEATFAAMSVRGIAADIRGFRLDLAPDSARDAAYGRLLALAGDGDLVLPVERFSLDAVSEAWARQIASPHGKLVVCPTG